MAMASHTCQICLEDVVENGKGNKMLTRICGKTCSALVCRPCLGRHVEVSLQQFYPGVLPRVRCPICLVDMHNSRWVGQVPKNMKSSLTSKYAELCRQACILTPPCCHKADYTHLPNVKEKKELRTTPTTPIKVLPSQLAQYKTLCRQFCRHKVSPRVVLNYAFDSFGDEKAAVLLNEFTLPRIMDPERRATLLLSLMYMRPNTKTLCCGAAFCFNCKRRGHHDACEEEFDEAEGLVRCRNCRVLLLKVEGCDYVNCVCGFEMYWTTEVNYRKQNKMKLIPVDMFDMPLFDQWRVHLSLLGGVLSDLRRRRLEQFTATIAPKLRPVAAGFIWRRRFRKSLANALIVYLQKKQVERLLVSVRPVISRFTAAFIWRWRFRHAFKAMQSELYWKAYQIRHPDEFKADVEDLNSMLLIGTYDD